MYSIVRGTEKYSLFWCLELCMCVCFKQESMHKFIWNWFWKLRTLLAGNFGRYDAHEAFRSKFCTLIFVNATPPIILMCTWCISMLACQGCRQIFAVGGLRYVSAQKLRVSGRAPKGWKYRCNTIAQSKFPREFSHGEASCNFPLYHIY